MPERASQVLEALPSGISRRRFSDLLLFGATLAELIALVRLTPAFTLVDWIYLLQHFVVFGIALTRGRPRAQDRSLPAALAVALSLTYPYAQVICLHWSAGRAAWPQGGLVLVTLSACLSLISLIAIGRMFGIRPALRGLATTGPYRLVRHPMYLAYVLGDIGYNLEEWNGGTLLMVMAGWASLLYRIRAEERLLSQDVRWRAYARSVRCRLVPGVW
jgi:protein-S-isoprenylcysteine O-methyltransferase Ste14